MTLVRGDYRWLDSERGNPGPYGSNPIGVYTAVDRVSRGFDTHQQGSLQARFPWGSHVERSHPAAPAGDVRRSRQPVPQQLRRLLLRDAPHDGTRADRSRGHDSDRRLVRRGGTGRARARHLLHRRSSAARADRATHVRRVRRGPAAGGRSRVVDGGAARRLDSTRRARRRSLRLRASAAVRGRHGELGQPPRLCRARRLAGRQRRRAHEAAGQRRNGHPSAGRLRDRVHRQPLARAGAQPQRRRRRQPSW